MVSNEYMHDGMFLVAEELHVLLDLEMPMRTFMFLVSAATKKRSDRIEAAKQAASLAR